MAGLGGGVYPVFDSRPPGRARKKRVAGFSRRPVIRRFCSEAQKPERERPGSSPCTVIGSPACTVAPILPLKSSCFK